MFRLVIALLVINSGDEIIFNINFCEIYQVISHGNEKLIIKKFFTHNFILPLNTTSSNSNTSEKKIK